jgi:phosphoribosylanthranilate isomerase
MIIDKVMIAGMDDKTSITELEKIKEEFPFVEWGVLFSKNKVGTARYPSLEYIDRLTKSKCGFMSAHFCGEYPREILEQGDLSEICALSPQFGAIQLNYNFERSKKWKRRHISKLLNNSFDIGVDVIFQMNKSNAPLVKKLPTKLPMRSIIRVLHDASGGRGTEIESLEAPTWENYTGFAGGINPVNIVKTSRTIIDNPSDKRVWLDLESGVRTDDEFDLDKVRDLLANVEPFITEYNESN